MENYNSFQRQIYIRCHQAVQTALRIRVCNSKNISIFLTKLMLSDSKEQSQYVGSKKHHDILLILNDNDKSRFFAPVPVVDAQAGLQRYCWYVQKCFFFSELFQCPANYFKCPKHFCIDTRFVCDGVSHCLYGEDEQNCGKVYCIRTNTAAQW